MRETRHGHNEKRDTNNNKRCVNMGIINKEVRSNFKVLQKLYLTS